MLHSLIKRVRGITGKELVTHRMTQPAAKGLRPFRWLPELPTPDRYEGDHFRYRQHVVRTGPDGRFSIDFLAWLPGQETPIHDQLGWRVTGKYDEETDQRFSLARDKGKPIEVKGTTDPAGHFSGVVRTGETHRVRNSNKRVRQLDSNL